MRKFKDTFEQFAFDRGSVRTVDSDGRMHIAITNISKANVCPYYGREIPDSERLGLDPNAVYYLLRDPAELEKAAATFNNLPLLDEHVPVSADEPMKHLIVGSTGTDAVFKAPYLMNSMVIWDSVAIGGIESDQQRELSSAYRYDADMTPGIYEGQKYDGVMRNIIGNHVALVEEGRAGPDVLAADSQPQPLEPSIMKLSRKAIALQGALKAYLRPKLASDAQIGDLRSLVAHVTQNNLTKNAPAIMRAVKTRFTPKLAKDADLEDLIDVIDMLKEDDGPDDVIEDDIDEPDMSMDDDVCAQVMSMLGGKVDDATLAKIRSALSGTAMDAEEDDEKDDKKDDDKKDKKEMAKDNPPPTPGTPKPPTPMKAAMDTAIKKAMKIAEDATVERMNAIREAEDAVRPLIGDVVRQHRAEDVYKLALDANEIDLIGVPEVAYKALVQMLRNKASSSMPARLAVDSNSISSFEKMFPNARIPQRGV